MQTKAAPAAEHEGSVSLAARTGDLDRNEIITRKCRGSRPVGVCEGLSHEKMALRQEQLHHLALLLIFKSYMVRVGAMYDKCPNMEIVSYQHLDPA